MESISVTMPKKRIKINRLFLIGNGFDLSLGLKTKYSDFLLWLFKKEALKAINSKINKTPIEKYKGLFDKFSEEYISIKIYGYAENKLFDILIRTRSVKDLVSKINTLHDLNSLFEFFETNNKIEILPNQNSILMLKLIKNSRENWVDIENIYFEILKEIIKNKKSRSNYDYASSLNFVNNELTELTNYLEEYLLQLNIQINKNDALKYFKQFDETMKSEDFLENDLIYEKLMTGENYFLNFNYTKSITELLDHFPTFTYTQNFIHGKLGYEDIIIGFGDEMDSIYKEIEELNDNRFFKHIKSFHYFRNPNQRKLQTFLNSGLYQVCVYGHSCGLSDRVMLNEIFEHDNCKSIKIYYYSDEDFTTKTMEISRHFNSNQLMRKKIVDKGGDCLIPQVSNDFT